MMMRQCEEIVDTTTDNTHTHTHRYDRSIWRQIRNPAWWVLTLISLIPFYGIPQIFYLLLLWAKDTQDEYQVCSFVVAFKGVSFLTLGVIPAIRGAFFYFWCLYNLASDGDDNEIVLLTHRQRNECVRNGPGNEPLWLLIFFLLQVVLIYVAFIRLPYTLKKGGKRYKVRARADREYDLDDDGILSASEAARMHRVRAELAMADDDEDPPRDGEERTPSTCCGARRYRGRGGLLRTMIVYDFVIFFLVAVAIGVAALATGRKSLLERGFESNAKFRASVYWCKTAYGLLSFPFLIFKMPFMFRLLTHARPTAYNRNGVTVAPVAPVSRAQAKAARIAPADVDVEHGSSHVESDDGGLAESDESGEERAVFRRLFGRGGSSSS